MCKIWMTTLNRFHLVVKVISMETTVYISLCINVRKYILIRSLDNIEFSQFNFLLFFSIPEVS